MKAHTCRNESSMGGLRLSSGIDLPQESSKWVVLGWGGVRKHIVKGSSETEMNELTE